LVAYASEESFDETDLDLLGAVEDDTEAAESFG
jgi:hypothetical protein